MDESWWFVEEVALAHAANVEHLHDSSVGMVVRFWINAQTPLHLC